MQATYNIYKAAVIYQQPKVTNDTLIIIKIKEVIKEVTGVGFEQINQNTRKREVMLARQLFQFLSKKYTTQTLKFVGALTAKKYDHSSVINSIERINNILDLKTRSIDYAKVESAINRMNAYTGRRL